jgi:hypothetical protein
MSSQQMPPTRERASFGAIRAAEGKVMFEHDHGQLTIGFDYLQEIPAVVVRAEFLSAEMECRTCHGVLSPQQLPALLEHWGQILAESLLANQRRLACGG